ncbi:MAG: hypothetical protein ACFB12_00075 [Leptolyngbyaceae cyanobacterium]
MQLGSRSLAIRNETLRVLVRELGHECSRVLELVHQPQFTGFQDSQKVGILAELTTPSVHLCTHCDEDFQHAIADELERLPDTDLDER